MVAPVHDFDHQRRYGGFGRGRNQFRSIEHEEFGQNGLAGTIAQLISRYRRRCEYTLLIVRHHPAFTLINNVILFKKKKKIDE